jgi:hypothetical protein
MKAGLAAREVGFDKLEKLYSAPVARRPSSFDLTLEGMGRNTHEIGGLGGASKGVGEYVNQAKAQYALDDFNHQKRINAITDQLELARIRSGCQ